MKSGALSPCFEHRPRRLSSLRRVAFVRPLRRRSCCPTPLPGRRIGARRRRTGRRRLPAGICDGPIVYPFAFFNEGDRQRWPADPRADLEAAREVADHQPHRQRPCLLAERPSGRLQPQHHERRPGGNQHLRRPRQRLRRAPADHRHHLATANRPSPPTASEIVFSRESNGGPRTIHLFEVPLAGGEPKQLTSRPRLRHRTGLHPRRQQSSSPRSPSPTPAPTSTRCPPPVAPASSSSAALATRRARRLAERQAPRLLQQPPRRSADLHRPDRRQPPEGGHPQPPRLRQLAASSVPLSRPTAPTSSSSGRPLCLGHRRLPPRRLKRRRSSRKRGRRRRLRLRRRRPAWGRALH